jgi:hypothetical protein
MISEQKVRAAARRAGLAARVRSESRHIYHNL